MPHLILVVLVIASTSHSQDFDFNNVSTQFATQREDTTLSSKLMTPQGGDDTWAPHKRDVDPIEAKVETTQQPMHDMIPPYGRNFSPTAKQVDTTPQAMHATLQSTTPEDPCSSYDVNKEVAKFIKTCKTCKGQCGEYLYHIGFGIQACHCDFACIFYHDCCPDFDVECPTIIAEARRRFPEESNYSPFKVLSEDEVKDTIPKQVTPKYTCREVSTKFGDMKVKMVTDCLGIPCPFDESYQDVNLFVHVVDIDTGIHYLNAKCAICNGVTSLKPWEPALICRFPNTLLHHFLGKIIGIKPEKSSSHLNIDSSDDLSDIQSFSENCHVHYQTLGGFPVHHCPKVLGCTCESEMCRHTQPLTVAVRSYNYNTVNPYCALQHCQWSPEDVLCGIFDPMGGTSVDLLGVNGGFAFLSLSQMMDFNPREGLKLRLPHAECPEDEVWVIEENICRKKACPSGMAPHKGQCTTFAKLSFAFSLFNLSDHGNYDFSSLTSYMVLHEHIEAVSGIPSFVHNQSDSGYIQGNLQVFPVNASIVNEALLFSLLSHGISETVGKHIIFSALVFHLEMPEKNDSVVLNCTWIRYSTDEVEISNNNSSQPAVIINSVPKTPVSFYIEDGIVSVCMVLAKRSILKFDVAKGVLTFTFLSGAMICLLIRLILQPFIQSYKLYPGRLQFHTALAILLFVLMQLLSPWLAQYDVSCKIVGALKMCAFLSMFVWLNIISTDSYVTFGFPDTLSNTPDDSRSTLKPALAGWLMPLLYTAFVFSLDYTPLPYEWKPNFRLNCWISGGYPLVAFFVVPVAISCIFNLMMFSQTVHALKRTLQTSAEILANTNQKKSHIFVYFRLFILMGLEWIVFVIAAVVDDDILWIIAIILCSSQGIFVFVSFVCRKKIWNQLKDICSHYGEERSNGAPHSN